MTVQLATHHTAKPLAGKHAKNVGALHGRKHGVEVAQHVALKLAHEIENAVVVPEKVRHGALVVRRRHGEAQPLLDPRQDLGLPGVDARRLGRLVHDEGDPRVVGLSIGLRRGDVGGEAGGLYDGLRLGLVGDPLGWDEPSCCYVSVNQMKGAMTDIPPPVPLKSLICFQARGYARSMAAASSTGAGAALPSHSNQTVTAKTQADSRMMRIQRFGRSMATRTLQRRHCRGGGVGEVTACTGDAPCCVEADSPGRGECLQQTVSVATVRCVRCGVGDGETRGEAMRRQCADEGSRR